MKNSILSLLVILILSSCNVIKKQAEVVYSGEILSGKYEIKSLLGAPADKIFFEIDASEKIISGKTGCNNFSTKYKNNTNEITIGPLVATKMYCEEHVMKLESSLFKAFNGATNYVFDNNMFTISSEEGVLLRAFKIDQN
jgi:heat shock protein HslJ